MRESQLIFDGPTRLERAGFIAIAVFIIGFSATFAALPLVHLFREFQSGKLPWPLLGFTCLAVLFAALMIRLAWGYRVVILPYRFTVDRDLRCCGYLWNASWISRFDLTGTDALFVEASCFKSGWYWMLEARDGTRTGRRHLLRSFRAYPSEARAFEAGMEASARVGRHLQLPVESRPPVAH